MEYVKKEEVFKIYESSSISNVDINLLTILYQPFIGCKSSSLYTTLVNFSLLKSDNFTHGFLFDVMQINVSEFLSARKNLEAIGLLRSYYDRKNLCYIYELFPPKNPSEFFADHLLRGTLIKYLGESKVKEIASYFIVKENNNNLENLSASFLDVYSKDFDTDFDQNLLNKLNLKRNKPIEVTGKFSIDELKEKIAEKTQIIVNRITDKELNEIIRIATLYGVSLDDTVNKVDECFISTNDYGTKIDLDSFAKKIRDFAQFVVIDNRNESKEGKVQININGKTEFADEMQLICDLSPAEYIKYKQGGVPISKSDAKIVEMLSYKYKLNNQLINVVLYYGLSKCNDMINENYLTKIATSIIRKKIDNPLDALNYLQDNKMGYRSKSNNKQPSLLDFEKKENSVDKEDDVNEMSDEEFNRQLNEIMGK